ncbi:MAG: hypothetical protein VYE73_15155 [Acidobacteriota bacterium]|nr:hypothetical protein [Acidobacteriota bacterium]
MAAAAVVVLPLSLAAQEKEKKNQVEIVKAVGCAESAAGNPPSWWLKRATETEVTRQGVFTQPQVDEAMALELGGAEYQLVGVADFLDADGLLAWGQRAEFTTREQANATGELRAGHKVLVKGLRIEAEPAPRINLMVVVGLAESCE